MRLSCPGRGAASFTTRRRAGTLKVDPGTAAHHAASHSASKTRANALTALHSIRGTYLTRLVNLTYSDTA